MFDEDFGFVGVVAFTPPSDAWCDAVGGDDGAVLGGGVAAEDDGVRGVGLHILSVEPSQCRYSFPSLLPNKPAVGDGASFDGGEIAVRCADDTGG